MPKIIIISTSLSGTCQSIWCQVGHYRWCGQAGTIGRGNPRRFGRGGKQSSEEVKRKEGQSSTITPLTFLISESYFLPLPGTATVLERALVTNKLRLTPSLSALSTRAWCSDLGSLTVNLPLYLV